MEYWAMDAQSEERHEFKPQSLPRRHYICGTACTTGESDPLAALAAREDASKNILHEIR